MRTVIQSDDMSDELRIALWNVVHICYAEPAMREGAYIGEDLDTLVSALCIQRFDHPVDRLPHDLGSRWEFVRNHYFSSPWNVAYDVIEAVPQFYPDRLGRGSNEAFRELCNNVLERELSAYRFVGNELVPITNETEIGEVEEALRTAGADPVATHLSAALRMLGDREHPDYRNSVKESISAVEAACRSAVGNEKATLGDAVKLLQQSGGLHPALSGAFSKLYGYTSDEGGIRHALTEESATVGFPEAKFMLVACSAFVNLLRERVGGAS